MNVDEKVSNLEHIRYRGTLRRHNYPGTYALTLVEGSKPVPTHSLLNESSSDTLNHKSQLSSLNHIPEGGVDPQCRGDTCIDQSFIPYHRKTRNFSLGPHYGANSDITTRTVEAICDQLASHPLLDKVFENKSYPTQPPIHRARSSPAVHRHLRNQSHSSDSTSYSSKLDVPIESRLRRFGVSRSVPAIHMSTERSRRASTATRSSSTMEKHSECESSASGAQDLLPGPLSGEHGTSIPEDAVFSRFKSLLSNANKQQGLTVDVLSAGELMPYTPEATSADTQDYSGQSYLQTPSTPSNMCMDPFAPEFCQSWIETRNSSICGDATDSVMEAHDPKKRKSRFERIKLALFQRKMRGRDAEKINRKKQKTETEVFKARQVEIENIIRRPITPFRPTFENETEDMTARRVVALRQAHGQNLANKKAMELVGIGQNIEKRPVTASTTDSGIHQLSVEDQNNFRLTAWIGEQRNLHKATTADNFPSWTPLNNQRMHHEEAPPCRSVHGQPSARTPVSGLQDIGRARKIFHTSTEIRKICVAPKSDSNGKIRLTPIRSQRSIDGSIVLPSHTAPTSKEEPQCSEYELTESEYSELSSDSPCSDHNELNFVNLSSSEDETEKLPIQSSPRENLATLQPNGYGPKKNECIQENEAQSIAVRQPEVELTEEPILNKSYHPKTPPRTPTPTPVASIRTEGLEAPTYEYSSDEAAPPPVVPLHPLRRSRRIIFSSRLRGPRLGIQTARSVPLLRSVPVIQDLPKSSGSSPRADQKTDLPPQSFQIPELSASLQFLGASLIPGYPEIEIDGEKLEDISGKEMAAVEDALMRFEGTIRPLGRRLSAIAEEVDERRRKKREKREIAMIQKKNNEGKEDGDADDEWEDCSNSDQETGFAWNHNE